MSILLSVSESLKRLEVSVGTHTNFVESLKQYTATVQRLTYECAQRIRSMGRGVAEHYLKQWFRNFLATMDECHLLQTGEIRRAYQLEEHKEHLHDRGVESQYYKTNQLSMVSVDGLNYEYRSLYARAKTKTRDRMDDVINSQLAVLETAIQKCKKDLDAVALRMEKALRDVGAVADISSQPMLEFVSVYWSIDEDDECLDLMGDNGEFVQPDVRFRFDRSQVSKKKIDGHVEVRADSMSTTLDEVENSLTLGTNPIITSGNSNSNSNILVSTKERHQLQKTVGTGIVQRTSKSRKVVDDSDDEDDGIENINTAKKRHEDDFDPLAGGKSVNVSMIQRKLGFNPEQINRSLQRLEKEDQYGDSGLNPEVDGDVEAEEDFVVFGDDDDDDGTPGHDDAMEVELSNEQIDNEKDNEAQNTIQKDKENYKSKQLEVKMDMKRWIKLEEKNGIVLAFGDREPLEPRNGNGLPLRHRSLLLRVRPSVNMLHGLPPKLQSKGRLDLFMTPRWRQTLNDSDVDELLSITLSINGLLDQLCLELWTSTPPVPLLPQSLVLHPADPTVSKKEFTRGEYINLYSKTHKQGKNGEQYDADGSLLGPNSRVNTVIKCCEGEEGQLVMQCLLAATEAQRLCSYALLHVPFIRSLLIACITHHRKKIIKNNIKNQEMDIEIDLEEVILPITEYNPSYLENNSSISWDLLGQAPAVAALLMKGGFPLNRIKLNGAQVDGSLIGALLACGCTQVEAVGCGLNLEHVREALIGLTATKYNHIHLNRLSDNSGNNNNNNVSDNNNNNNNNNNASDNNVSSSDILKVNVVLDLSFNALFCGRTGPSHETTWTNICQTILSLVLPQSKSETPVESDDKSSKVSLPASRVIFQITLNLSHCAESKAEVDLLCKGLTNAILSSSEFTAEISYTPILKVLLLGITTKTWGTDCESGGNEGLDLGMDDDLLKEMQSAGKTRNIKIIY